MRVAVAMSGGLDSSVVALLLHEQGHEVIGVSLRLWPESRCCAPEALQDAARVCAWLGVPHHVFGVEDRFAAAVVEPFCQAYLQGRTPNPCPGCNASLKFGLLWDRARAELGAKAVASGHYARVEREAGLGRWQLRKGLDPARDQSYMLALLGQAQLGSARFPLGTWHKAEARALAASRGLPWRDKPDSQDACFVLPDLGGFLRQQVPAALRPGLIVRRDGRIVGEHPGVAFYTPGQRKGLGRGHPEPLFVIELRAETAEVVVGSREECFAQQAHCPALHWVSLERVERLRVQARVRSRAPDAAAWLHSDGEGGRLVFDEPQLSIAPGQLAVAYVGDKVAAAGVIGAAPA